MDKYFWQMSIIDLPSTSSTPPSCSELQPHLNGQEQDLAQEWLARLKGGSASLWLCG
jgi:hypothetical protein